MIAGLLRKFAAWALAKNAPGGYAGEDDERWAYTIETLGDKYLTRVFLAPKIAGLVRPMLHNFHRPDSDRYLHNHPWRWAFSIVLSGSYDEERLVDDSGETKHRRVRWFNVLRADDYHRVTKLHGDVWTLFVTGPRVQDWGFLVDGERVPWTEYLKRVAQ